MPDITMCQNDACTLRHECYRFTAKPNPFYQSYGVFEPYMKKLRYDGRVVDELPYCKHFIDNAVYSKNQPKTP